MYSTFTPIVLDHIQSQVNTTFHKSNCLLLLSLDQDVTFLPPRSSTLPPFKMCFLGVFSLTSSKCYAHSPSIASGISPISLHHPITTNPPHHTNVTKLTLSFAPPSGPSTKSCHPRPTHNSAIISQQSTL